MTADKGDNVSSIFLEISSSSSAEQNDHHSPILKDSTFRYVDEDSNTKNDQWMYETYFSDSSEKASDSFYLPNIYQIKKANQRILCFEFP